MVEVGRHLGLALEALDKGGVPQQVGGQDLEGHGAIQGGVHGLVDGGKAAPPHLFNDLVFAQFLRN